MREITLFFDGACRPNEPNGHGGFGYVLREEHGLVQGRGHLNPFPGLCAQVAEWVGLLAGLHCVQQHFAGNKLSIRGDSQFVLKTLDDGETPHLNLKFRQLYRGARNMLQENRARFNFVSGNDNPAHQLAERGVTSKAPDETAMVTEILNDLEGVLPIPTQDFLAMKADERRSLRNRLCDNHRHREYSLLAFRAFSRQADMPELGWTHHQAALSLLNGTQLVGWSCRKQEEKQNRTWYRFRRGPLQFRARFCDGRIGFFDKVSPV